MSQPRRSFRHVDFSRPILEQYEAGQLDQREIVALYEFEPRVREELDYIRALTEDGDRRLSADEIASDYVTNPTFRALIDIGYALRDKETPAGRATPLAQSRRRRRGGDVVVRLGALWLGLVGALLLVVGGLAACAGLAPNEPASGMDLSGFMVAGGLIALVVGVPHMAAAIGAWRRRTWGRWLGAGLGGVGLAYALLGAVIGGVSGLAVVMAVGYGSALVGSVVWYPTEPPAPT